MPENPCLWVMAQRCRVLFRVGTRVIELVGAVCCFVCSRGTDTGRALAKWWSLGYICPPTHHFFNVKTVKVGGFEAGMVCHGTADELGLG